MSSSSVRTFADGDEYAAAIKRAQVELTILERGVFKAKLVNVYLPRLIIGQFANSLPRITDLTPTADAVGRSFIGYRLQPGPSLMHNGTELRASQILSFGPNDGGFYQRSFGPTVFGTTSLPVEDLVAFAEAIAGLDLTVLPTPTQMTPLPGALARFLRLCAAAAYLAEHAPEIITNPGAAQGLEQVMIEAMVDCLAGEANESSLAQRQHTIVMRRFRDFVHDQPGRLHIPEICRAIGVTSRTLLTCCREHLGMAPTAYLLRRRMHLVRRALRRASPDTASVREIVMSHGFWHLGRFAAEYQALFGEAPSVTLRR